MESIIAGVEEVYRDNSRNGELSIETLADGRCHDDDHRPGSTGSIVKSQSARFVCFAVCSLCGCSASYHRSRIW
jgi:hypothetical protein